MQLSCFKRALTRPALLAVVAAVFGAQLLLVACSSAGDPTPAPVPTVTVVAPTPTATPYPAPTAARPAPPDLQRGGILRLAIKEAPPHQDVHQSVSNVLATWGAGLAYSRLFRYQSGTDVPLPSRIPECDLCSSWAQTGPLEFEFIIRDDAYWPEVAPLNGRRVTAQDIVASYQRQMTPGWPNSEILANLQEITALDENRLLIRLKTPDAELFERLADGHSVVIAEEAVALNGDLINGPTLGSGPWILEEASAGSATFEANRNYYDVAVPYLDGLAVQFIPQASTRAAGVRSGILDLVETSSEEVASAVEKFPELRSVKFTQPDSGVELAINTTRRPLDAIVVRQAVLLAWDIDSALAEIWGDDFLPSAGLNVPHPGWRANFRSRFGKMFGDVDAANALLNAAGLTPGDRIAITVGEFGESAESDRFVQTAESLADALNSLGLATDVARVTTREFADDVWIRGDYDIFVGAPPPISSLSGQLFGIYHSDGPWNTTGYSTDALDRLIEQQAVESGFAERGQLLQEIQDEIMAGAHRFYPVTTASHWLWRPAVRDVFPDTSGATAGFLTKIWLSRE